MTAVELIDTHVHLDDARFEADRPAVIARAHQAGVTPVLMSVDPASAQRALALARAHGWRCAVGVHPNAADRAGPTLESILRKLASAPEVVAIGEIGLDYYRDTVAPNVQREVFSRQLALALALDLPVVLHNRQANGDLLDELRRFPGVRGAAHCFLGDAALAEAFLELGFQLGIGGPLTFKANAPLRQVVAGLPLERLLLETDSPYLAPAPHRGQRNEPAHVRHVAEALAALKGLPLDQVAQTTTANARALFGTLPA